MAPLDKMDPRRAKSAPGALEIAEEILPKIDSILLKLPDLENKIDRMESHVGNIVETLSKLKRKVDSLMIVLNRLCKRKLS